MPFIEHPAFSLPVDRDSTIWRYNTLAKLIDLLETKLLFFSRADLLGDPLEGSLPQLNPPLRALQNLAFMPDTEKGRESARRITETMSRLYEHTRYRTAINCWREDEHESAAMWKLYASENEGVAIKSTIRSLCESFDDAPQPIHVGRVKYIDFEHDTIEEGNLFNPFMHKRRSFDYEREVRAALTFGMKEPSEILDFGNIPSDPGISVPVDLARLISGVVVSPAAPDWFYNVVQKTVERVVPELQVSRSSMSGHAIY